ncbi:Odorant receptor 46 [Ephemera danica]|nr:Odorant receptor 46 [Ephemera danica]
MVIETIRTQLHSSEWQREHETAEVLVGAHLVISPAFMTPSNVTLTAAFVSNSLQTAMRHIYFFVRRKQIAELVENIRSSPSKESVDVGAAETAMRLTSATQVHHYSAVIALHHACAAAVSSVFIFILPTVLQSSENPPRRPLYSEMWFPYDLKDPLVHTYVLFWQALAVLLNVASAATTDAFTCSVMLVTAERSAMLARVAPKALLPSQGNLTPHFRAWVKHHQHYLGLFSRINTLMGPIIFSVHLFGIINIIVFAYLIMKVDLFSMLVALAHLASVLLQVYTFANAGQRVIDNSEELGRNTLSAAQVARGGLCEGHARSALLVLVARCSGARPEELSGMGYFTVSVPLFSAVLGASVSFLLVLVQFK